MQVSNNPSEDFEMASIAKRNSTISSAVNARLVTIDEMNENMARRSMLYTIVGSFFLFFFGTLYYHKALGWNLFDSFYFCVITFTTVGYGDFHVIDDRQRIFTSIYIIFGVGIVGGLIGIASSNFQEHNERMAKKRNMLIIQNMDEYESSLSSRLKSFSTNTVKSINVMYKTSASLSMKYFHYLTCDSFRSIQDQPISDDARSDLEVARISNNELYEMSCDCVRDIYVREYDRDIRQLRYNFIFDLIVIFFLTCIGMLIMMGIEDWSSGEAFYWACVTISTIGYGDVVPNTTHGRVFTIFYAIFGCTYMAKSMSNVVKYPVVAKERSNEIRLLDQFGDGRNMSSEKLIEIHNSDLLKKYPKLKSNPDSLSNGEFVLLVMYAMNKIDEKDVLLLSKVFESLDVNGNGCLSNTEIDEKISEARLRESLTGNTSQGKRNTSISETIKSMIGMKPIASTSPGGSYADSNTSRSDNDQSLITPSSQLNKPLL